MISYDNRDTLAAYVNDQLWSLNPSSVLTMTILRDLSGVCSVVSVITVLSEDSVGIQSNPYSTISLGNTQDG